MNILIILILFIVLKGLRVPVSKARYRTIESLLDDLNSNISMPFGVRHLTTPRGKTLIKSIDQLQHHGRLVTLLLILTQYLFHSLHGYIGIGKSNY